MKTRPISTRIAKTAAFVLMWPFAVMASMIYLTVSITLDIATKILGVWE